MYKGAAYIRVSTTEQIEFSPEAQKKAILAYTEKNNITIDPEHFFTDEGFSGRKAEKRPAFMRMIKIAKTKPKPFDLIIVHRFDRFARNREDSVVYKSLLKKEQGIRVISVTEQLEDDKFSIILESMLEAMAEYYSLNLADEVKKGMTEKARRGGFQAKPPLGYDIFEKGKPPMVVEEEAPIIKYIFDKFANEGSVPSIIAQQLNDMGYRTRNQNRFETRGIVYILNNPIYCGYTRWNYRKKNKVNDPAEWIINQGEHELIVTKELWDQAQVILANSRNVDSKKARPSSEYKHWLSGVMKCSYCNGAMTYAQTHGYEYFRCNKKMKGSCNHSNYIRVNILEEAILGKLQKDMHNVEYFVDNMDADEDDFELKMLHKQLEQLDRKLHRIKEAYIAEIDSLEEYKCNKDKLLREETQINNQIALVENQLINQKKESFKTYMISTYQYLKDESRPIAERNKVLKAIVKYIKVDQPNEKLTIRYYLREEAIENR
ncbi:recombinase family protein [Vallitalea okinawensis]|uniref:recombinase family protein n=1 Tax=Vallitalea okinawensis TaxID=2078660 RepID=UPI000CFDE842|nr:recombinase family protein [Vallitalea okinawensis]